MKIILCACLALLISPLAASADKGGKPKDGKQKQIKIDLALAPSVSLDANAAGEFHYKKNKGRSDLRTELTIPAEEAASLSIIDEATAAAADILVDIVRWPTDGEPVAITCKLELLAPEGTPTVWQYRLKLVQNTPRARLKQVKGECDAMPALSTKEALSVEVYLLSGETRVPIVIGNREP